jgi:TIR domain
MRPLGAISGALSSVRRADRHESLCDRRFYGRTWFAGGSGSGVDLARSMETIGRDLIAAGDDLLVCSPYPDSVDTWAVRGAAEALAAREGPVIEFHYPDHEEVKGLLASLVRTIPENRIQRYPQPVSRNEQAQPEWRYAWLLCQIAAMDRSHAVIALGGRLAQSASLLLQLARNRRKIVLPLSFLGGAGAECFDQRRHELADRLGDDIAALHSAERIGQAVELLDRLAKARPAGLPSLSPPEVFVSYARCRPQDADYVEMALRRRDVRVYRDEQDFGAGRAIQGEITEHIHRASVFIALWCREYACSPWCYDELQLALERARSGKLEIWMFCLDDTRIVPPAARELVSFPGQTRGEIERHLCQPPGPQQSNIKPDQQELK